MKIVDFEIGICEGARWRNLTLNWWSSSATAKKWGRWIISNRIYLLSREETMREMCVCVCVCLCIRKQFYIWSTFLRFFSSVLSCVFKLPCENILSHNLHFYGFSRVCILLCPFKLPLLVNILSHTLHLYGFSPVWILSCLFK